MDAALSVSPLSGHGVALALHGAVLAAEDPVRYREWLLRTALDHAAEETACMSHAGGRTKQSPAPRPAAPPGGPRHPTRTPTARRQRRLE
jgi:hypothetical protein